MQSIQAMYALTHELIKGQINDLTVDMRQCTCIQYLDTGENLIFYVK